MTEPTVHVARAPEKPRRSAVLVAIAIAQLRREHAERRAKMQPVEEKAA